MRIAYHAVSLVAAAALAWFAVVDNSSVCHDVAVEQGDASHRHDAPQNSHCCLTAPCHTPAVSRPVTQLVVPASVILAAVPAPPRALTSIDSPAPPTPPPTVLD